jgi:hypothetical protein
MTTPELPTWTDCTVTVGTEYAKYLEESGTTLGGLRIMDLGDGRAALGTDAVAALRRQPEDADGYIEDTPDGLVLWIQGAAFSLTPAA